ncbi:TPA: ATP-binding cassette protein C4-like [Bos taurus]|nr:TPA: ATP-binding cassette protein C4-like [Bos taurus]
MVQKGIYAEFPKPGIDFEDILLTNEDEEAEPSPGPGTPTLRNWSSSESSVQSLQSSSPSLKDATPEDKDTENIQAIPSLESCSIGMVGFKIYKNCFRAGAHWFIIVFLILINVAAQVAYVLQDWWLADWANEKSTLYAMVFGQGNMIVMPDPDWYLGTYSGLMVATGLFSIARSMLLIYVLVNSSQTLHNEMLESILKAPVLFFDRNPIGRILNRFSKDTGHMDDSLPLTFLDFIQMFILMTGVAGVMVGVIPWIAIPVIPLSIIFFLLRIYFLWTYGDIKRLECTTRSPVFSHLASSLQGLWSIRAYKAEQRFQEVFDAHQDLHSEAWFLLLTTFQWFAVRLDIICAVFFIVICFGSLMLAKTLNPGQFGLVLSLALTFTWIFQWCIRQSAEVEKMMVSAERVVEYTELEKEAPWEYEYRPPLDWPHEGELAFENVNFRHTLDGPLVLKDLTECTESKEKTGIVGRTGAGKSSLIAALFRLSEPIGGIWIDNISITSIGLHHLRKKMSVVPQEAVLFTGTMRKNLDPFDEHTNEELWNALEEVRLKETIESLPSKMDTELVESGSNLSVGQRQLLCLARGILRKNRILIIDNATSYVDPRTDELIQKNIREKFSECTVLTITHRLSTIIDSEWIMVWDSGILEDYDEPYSMLQDRDNLFYKMVQQLGEAEATVLTERAKQNTDLLRIGSCVVDGVCTSKDITHNDHVIMNTYSGQPSVLTIFESTLCLNPLFKIGYKQKLEDGMYSLLPEDRSQHLGEELQGTPVSSKPPSIGQPQSTLY